MEHVTIISQEAITRGLWWPVVVVGVIGILFVLAAWISSIPDIKRGDTTISSERPINLLIHAAAVVPIMFLTMMICTIFFPVETGRYKYEGTLDPNMTIVEFEEFEQQYSNVRFEDGVWKWEDKNE